MDLGLSGRVALVTGGARGIGAAIALELCREGVEVAIVDKNAETLEALRQQAHTGSRLVAFQADVSNLPEAERITAEVTEKLGRLDILVCSAGITRDGLASKLSEADWDLVLDVNLKGCFAYCRAAAAVFQKQKSGRIVNIASINGLRGKFGQANYAASKAGMIGLTKVLARELGKYGVTANVVAPGMVKTELSAGLPQEFLDAAAKESVLGHIAEPVDVARAVVFLCSEAARHITGEVLRVDGGQYI